MPEPYQLVATFPGTQMQTVLRVATGEFIPFDPANKDFQAFLAWKAEGNEPDPAQEPQPATEA
jgi:hypothetical protein